MDGQGTPGVCHDETYRQILGRSAWNELRPEIRRRFSVKPESDGAISYKGQMQTVWLSPMGWLFAQVCRLIGTPLTTLCGKNVPVTVVLIPNAQLDGVTWLRRYEFAGRDITVRSTKSHAAGNVLREHIGCGFSMRLSLAEQNGALVFSSEAYELRIPGGWLPIPALLTPGVTTVTHEQIEGDRFRFTLSVVHPLLGRTVYQAGEFHSADVNEL